MLDSLRKSVGSWFVKIFLGLLVLSFAIWGIGDIFTGGRNQPLASIGDRDITPEEFERNYRNQINLVSNQLGRQITNQEARAFGIGQNVLQNLISTTAIDIHAQALGLGISEDAIADSIRKEPVFQGVGNQFDRQRFDEILRNIGMSEQGFVALQREEMVREQLAGALSRSVYAPKTLLDAMHRYRNDERVLDYFLLSSTVAGEVSLPEETALRTYFDDNKTSYTAPEYRKIGILSLTADSIKETVALTDDELKAAFEATKAQYSTPERRTIQQLTFKDIAAARDAAGKLAAGADFVQLGKELGLKESDINLGVFAKTGLADKKVAEAAFALPKGGVSEPIESFFPIIVKIADIAPGEEKTFEQVRDEVRSKLAEERARSEIQKLYDTIEDARAGGANVAEAARSVNLPYAEATVDRRGLGQDGKVVEKLGGVGTAINLIFESDVGVENNPVTAGDGYLFIDVLEVIPDRQKNFEEVRTEVEKAWIAEETRKRVRAKADDLAEKARNGASFETLAQEIGVSVSKTAALKRNAAPQELPRTAVSVAFALPEKGIGVVQMPDSQSHAVIQLAEIREAPALTDAQADALRAELKQTLSVDILTQYVGALQKVYGVSLNSQAISTVLGQ